MGEKGYNQTLGKSGKRYPKGFPYPDSKCESPAGAALEPPRCQTIDYSRHSRRIGHTLVNPAGAAVTPFRHRKIDYSHHNRRTGHALSVDAATEYVEEWGADRSFSDIEDDWNHDYGYDDLGDDDYNIDNDIDFWRRVGD